MEPELLSMVPRPVCAVLLLFPITEKYETFRTEEEERIKAKGQDVKSSVYFMKQTINNACGTIGLIHAIANNRDKMNFETNSSLKKFLEDSLSMTPEERAKYLETYEAIRVTHESSAHEGQTEAPSIDEKVDLHFIALVNVGGHLYELDGRKPFPINHGETSDDSFLEDAIEVCKKFMERDPEELRFNAIALKNEWGYARSTLAGFSFFIEKKEAWESVLSLRNISCTLKKKLECLSKTCHLESPVIHFSEHCCEMPKEDCTAEIHLTQHGQCNSLPELVQPCFGTGFGTVSRTTGTLPEPCHLCVEEHGLATGMQSQEIPLQPLQSGLAVHTIA
ncbi:Ubiquitin carboxyl-terminal hydrolase isozyme L3 [Lamprotornis superbus]|uniref:Ubiquitin carboxyl-terminal hydrolase n=1 Tax=Lamprotornis superbus TaxID=245042 RepID=A0A835TYR8_9PASS|nr:Ubiquitin carboxyl-terminal hydrolase isozyme L3 [Lamprotornis superbus]